MKYFLISLVLVLAPGGALFPQKNMINRPPFTLQQAIFDTTLTDDVREAFADDDGRPLKSIAVDLNGDGKHEKLIPNEFLCGSGGCPWVIFEPGSRRILGEINAKEIEVLSQKVNGYFSLKCSWSLGADRLTFTHYAFDGRKYAEQ